MEYNNYYQAQTATHPPPMPPMQSHQQHGCSPVQIMPGASMMHQPGPPLQPPPPHQGVMVRQVVTPGPPSGVHQQQMQQQPLPPQQQQQHMGPHHMQAMPPQQQHQQPPSHHPNYHQQLPPHPPLSHSASPHHLQSPHHNHQTNLNLQPPSRPSTGPSPHHPMHQQSPHHIGSVVGPGGAPMHISQQQPSLPPQMNASASPRLIPPGTNHQGPMQPGLGPPPPHHQHNNHGGYMGPSTPMSLPSPHYPQQQTPHAQQPHGPPPINHGPPPGPPMQQMPPSSAYHPGHPGPHPSLIDRSSPFYQPISQAEIRIIEFNKRLQNRPRSRVPNSPLPLVESSGESYWWEKFACDFFDDESTLTLRLPSDDKPIEYTIGRTLIPRFFRSYFEGGVVDFSIKLRNTREITQIPNLITLDCDQADVTTKIFTKHPNSQFPMNVIVHTEGQLSLDFVSNNFDNLLIRSWRFNTMQCREYIDRSITTTGLPNTYLIEPVTRHGLTKQTIAYLKMCMIMEPMQELMLTHRQTKMDPRSCLKDLLYNKYKLKNIDDNRVQPNKRRKRKTPAATGAGATKKTKANNAQQAMNNNSMGYNNINNNLMTPPGVGSAGVPNMSLASQDVMVVGEPSMLGADFGDENERRITRLENNQFDSPHNTNHNSTPNINNNNNEITQNNNLNQGQNQMCSSNQNLNQNQSNNLNHMQQQQQSQQKQQQHQNNHDTGNIQMMNHTNNTSNTNSASGNSNGTNISNSNNNGTNDSNNGNSNMNGSNNNCIQNNNINHQMSPMINMNGNINHMGHLVKSEPDLKQSAPPTSDAEAR